MYSVNLKLQIIINKLQKNEIDGNSIGRLFNFAGAKNVIQHPNSKWHFLVMLLCYKISQNYGYITLEINYKKIKLVLFQNLNLPAPV